MQVLSGGFLLYSSGTTSGHQMALRRFSLRTKGKGVLLPPFYELFQNLILLELTTRTLFLSSQAHGVHTEGEVVYVPFPLDCKYGESRKYT